jgi:hypothetical protein
VQIMGQEYSREPELVLINFGAIIVERETRVKTIAAVLMSFLMNVL